MHENSETLSSNAFKLICGAFNESFVLRFLR